jgi:hypothetical protein
VFALRVNLNDHVPGGQNDGARGALQGANLHPDGPQTNQFSLTTHQSPSCAGQLGLHFGLNIILSTVRHIDHGIRWTGQVTLSASQHQVRNFGIVRGYIGGLRYHRD